MFNTILLPPAKNSLLSPFATSKASMSLVKPNIHSIKCKQTAREEGNGNIMKKIKPLASLQSTCFSVFNGFTMIVYNQGATTDLITRSSQWPQANHMLPSPGYKKPNTANQKTSYLRDKRIPRAMSTSCLHPVDGLSTTHYIQKRLSPLCITQGCTLPKFFFFWKPLTNIHRN